ncbi:serine carboxypeptidase, partial [Aureobasidium melanogenum]
MSIASPRPSLNLPSSRRSSSSTINSTRSPSTSRPASIRDNHTANSTPVPASTRRRDRAALREFYNLQATESPTKPAPSAPTSQPEDSGPQDALSALDSPSFSAKTYADELLNTSDAETLLRTLNSITISALGLEGDKKALVVEQPVGTGFSIGTPRATSEEQVAQDFIKFFKNFQRLFGTTNYKIYVTGKSYAGRYVPYTSAAMLGQNDTEYYDLSGALIYDPVIGNFDYTQEEVVIVPFAVQNQNILDLNTSFLAKMETLHQSCGYADYIDKYLTFPASGLQPPVLFNFTSNATCDLFDLINEAALVINPCFDIYEITQMCPLLWDVLGFPTQLVYSPMGADVYFSRTDVKRAIHAPLNVSWAECSNIDVFTGNNTGPETEGDTSPDPIQHVLPQVIEATNRVLIANGDFDMIIITNGTLMSIQNMTWNGKLGFQTQPSTPINITMPDLMYADVFASNGYKGLDGPQRIMGIQDLGRDANKGTDSIMNAASCGQRHSSLDICSRSFNREAHTAT